MRASGTLRVRLARHWGTTLDTRARVNVWARQSRPACWLHCSNWQPTGQRRRKHVCTRARRTCQCWWAPRSSGRARPRRARPRPRPPPRPPACCTPRRRPSWRRWSLRPPRPRRCRRWCTWRVAAARPSWRGPARSTPWATPRGMRRACCPASWPACAPACARRAPRGMLRGMRPRWRPPPRRPRRRPHLRPRPRPRPRRRLRLGRQSCRQLMRSPLPRPQRPPQLAAWLQREKWVPWLQRPCQAQGEARSAVQWLGLLLLRARLRRLRPARPLPRRAWPARLPLPLRQARPPRCPARLRRPPL